MNGPNLNLLGKRERDIYGDLTLEEINDLIIEMTKHLSVDLDFFVSNYEGDIVSRIGQSMDKYDAIVMNPGAYSHYSIAILDAIRSVNVPVVEVHLSNIHAREEFRQKSVTASGCQGVICGFGYLGYVMAINAICEKWGKKNV